MPRNGSGVYTLPAGNPVVPGTTIDAAWANSTLEDMANEITNSLSRTGAGGMIAPFRIADGVVSAPGLSFLNETNSGFYRAGTATITWVIQGVPVATFSTTGLSVPAGKTLAVAGTTNLSGTVNATGALNASDLNAVHVDLDLAGSAGAVGRMKWNPTDGTVDIGMLGGNVTQQVGLEQFYHVRASAAIAPGEVIMATGTLGASGKITAAPAIGNINPEYVMGVATESIASGADGYVTNFGLVRDINTTGGAEAWVDGQVLYFDPSTAGGLTKNIPTAPNPKVIVAIVVRAHATNGSLFVRVTHGSVLGQTDSNVQFTTLAANNMIRYNASTSRWENIAGPAGDVVGTTDTQTLTNKTISGGSVTGAAVTNLPSPTNNADAATKAYVDSVAEGLDAKASCLAATTANITLSGTQTIDGVSVGAGARVLVKNQTNAAENGIYVAASGAWTRASDANTWTELISAYTFIEQGTTQINNGYICTIQAGGVLGTNAVTWSQFSAAGVINPGAGLTKTGNTLDVVTASSARIVVNPDNIDLATTAVTPGTYTQVTVDAYGRATAGTTPTTIAGYSITDAYTKTQIDSIFGSTTSAAASASAAAASASAASSSASAAASSATAAANSFDSFDDRYLGSKTSDPTVDNDGNALLTGALYWNSVGNVMKVWSGTAWVVFNPVNNPVDQSDIGTAPNEIPLNQYLGDLAYQNAANIAGPVGIGGALTLSGGTANGVAYLNGSKVLTTGSALQFNGTDFGLGGTPVSVGVAGMPAYAALSATSGRSGAFYWQDTGANNVAYSYFFGSVFQFGTATNHPVAFMQSGSEQMRLTSTGLGIGTSSPAQTLHVKTSTAATPITLGVLSNATTLPALSFNGAYASTTMAGTYSLTGSLYTTVPSGAAQYFSIADSIKLTLDSSGNLGLGVTPTNVASYTNLEVRGSAGGLFYTSNSNGSVKGYFGNNASVVFLNAITNHPLTFGTNDTERARITSGGNLLVGTTSGVEHILRRSPSDGSAAIRLQNGNASGGTYVAVVEITGQSPNNATSYFISCFDSTAERATIRSNGGLANYSANNVNLSDQRLKTDVQLADNYLDKICAIPVKTFLYKDQTDTERNLGVMAQDVDAVAPELIDHNGFGETPEGESPYLSVYQTDLQYALMKCIQELKAELDSVKAELATLKGN